MIAGPRFLSVANTISYLSLAMVEMRFSTAGVMLVEGRVRDFISVLDVSNAEWKFVILFSAFSLAGGGCQESFRYNFGL